MLFFFSYRGNYNFLPLVHQTISVNDHHRKEAKYVGNVEISGFPPKNECTYNLFFPPADLTSPTNVVRHVSLTSLCYMPLWAEVFTELCSSGITALIDNDAQSVSIHYLTGN